MTKKNINTGGHSSQQFLNEVQKFVGGFKTGFPNQKKSFLTLARFKNLFKKPISNAIAFDGFTLAEVLITLAIIGVVASLTIPSVIVKYQKDQTVIKLKKAYTELSNAINQSSVINGLPNTWDYTLTNKAFFNKYLKPYLAVTKVCPDNKTTKQCFGVEYCAINKTTCNNQLSTAFRSEGYKVFLKDGTIIMFDRLNEEATGKYIWLFIDINGVKKPNIKGIDVFAFFLHEGTSKDTTKLYAWKQTKTREEIISEDCNKNSIRGDSCTALIIKDNWQIKDDYPWW